MSVSVAVLHIPVYLCILVDSFSFFFVFFFFLMIRRPPRSTLDRSSAASDVYKRQVLTLADLTVVDSGIAVESIAQLSTPILLIFAATIRAWTFFAGMRFLRATGSLFPLFIPALSLGLYLSLIHISEPTRPY